MEGTNRAVVPYVEGCLLFAIVYMHYGITIPFLPAWLKDKGMSVDQIAVLLAIPMFLKLIVIAPMMNLADRLRRVRDFICLFCVTGALVLYSLQFVSGFAAMATMTVLFAVLWDPIPVLTDAYGVGLARDRRLDFGRMRLWASATLMVVYSASGWILHVVGIRSTVWIGAACLAAPALVIPFLPSDRTFLGARPAAAGEWRTLLRDRGLLLMIPGVALIVASHQLLQSFSAIQWMGQNMSSTVVGALWATAVASEIVVLWAGRRLLGARPAALLVLIGGVTAVLRWSLMSIGLTPVLLFATQLLNGLSVMAPILGMMLYIERRAPPHLIASAQGLYGAVWSACMAVATVSCGPLDRLFGVRAYLAMAAVAGCGAIFGLAALRLEGHDSKKQADSNSSSPSSAPIPGATNAANA